MQVLLTTEDMQLETELLHLEADTDAGITRGAVVGQLADILKYKIREKVSNQHPAVLNHVIWRASGCAWRTRRACCRTMHCHYEFAFSLHPIPPTPYTYVANTLIQKFDLASTARCPARVNAG